VSSSATPTRDLLDLLIKEGRRRVLFLATVLSLVALGALAIGLWIPKRYDASALIAVESGATIKPLIEGRGVATANPQHAAITLQIMEGRKILRELLVFGGWVQAPPAPQPDALEEAKLFAKLRSRIRIETPSEGIIRISFNDTDPERAYKVANKLAEIYVRESGEAQERSSRDAFEFIDKQVKEYGEKLATYHAEVLAHYQKQPLPTLAPAGGGAGALPAKHTGLSRDEIAALQAEKATLEAQLARRPAANAANPTSVDAPRVDEVRARVAQLQREHDRLSATYTEQHPDVKRVKRDLAAASDELKRAEEARATHDADERSAAALDDDLVRAARARLDALNRRLAAETGAAYVPPAKQPATTAATLDPKADPEMKGIGRDTALSELLRRYEATRDVYQDLLKRRESARVSMELAAQHRGSTVRIQEPAERPVTATGLRLMHFCLIGLALAVMLPVAVLFLIVRFDRRVRSARQIEKLARVPLLVSISAAPADNERSRLATRRRLALLMIAGVVVVYVAVFIAKQKSGS
jgi:polysaccharide chain length determinant protein (PEP-CTERM system associated)